jgi:hypothetical protein
MPDVDAEVMATVRAAVQAIVPSVDGFPGAAEAGVERHVVHSLELFVPGFAQLLVTLLNAYAIDVRAGAAFTELSVEERGRVLRAMSAEDSPDLQDIVDALLVFAYGGHYSEWSGLDRSTGRLDPPRAWEQVGYLGPVEGHARYRQGV